MNQLISRVGLSNTLCIALFVSLFALPGCIKKSTVNNSPPAFVVTGDQESLEETLIAASKADVDKDGNMDIELKINAVKTGPGPSTAQEFVLVCLHPDIFLRADSVIIPLWQKRHDTVFVSEGTKWHKTSFLTDCTNAPGATVQNAYHYAQALRSAAEVKTMTSDHFMNGSFPLNKPSFSVTNPPSMQGDTSFINSYTSTYCHQLLKKEDNFFCFKIHSGERDRFGWILLNGDSPVMFVSSAISK